LLFLKREEIRKKEKTYDPPTAVEVDEGGGLLGGEGGDNTSHTKRGGEDKHEREGKERHKKKEGTTPAT